MSLLTSPDNGATEIPGTSNKSLAIFLGGPIRYWWKPGMWDSELHKKFVTARDCVYAALCEEFLVYAPFRALRGPWDEVKGTYINDCALKVADAMVVISANNVPMVGTEYEIAQMREAAKPVVGIEVPRSWAYFSMRLSMIMEYLTELRQNL